MCAFDSGWGKSSEAFVHLSAQRIAMMINLGEESRIAMAVWRKKEGMEIVLFSFLSCPVFLLWEPFGYGSYNPR